MRRSGMRTRLTVAVTAIFATASIVAGVVALRITEDRLLADTRANAEQMLSDYVGRLYGGTAAAPTVDAAESTSFFFLDAAGAELSERQYVTTLLSDTLVESRIGAPGSVAGSPPAVPSVSVTVAPGDVAGDVLAGGVGVDAAGRFVGNNGEVVRFALAPTPTGAPEAVDRGAGVVAVAQTFAMPNGDRLQVGVSSPLELVTDSVGAMRWLLWIGIPVVTAMVAAITWLTVTRALRPVHAITVRAREITASNLAEPVPVPAGRDEIHELATTVNQMLARLDANHRQQRQFVADASHELRSPVAASIVQLEVALARPDEVDWTASAGAVLAEQQQLGRLIDDLLALSRLDEDGVGTVTDVDLDDVIAAEAARPRAVVVDVVRCDAVRVQGSPALMTRLVRNVLDNAAQHATSRVEVSLSTISGATNGRIARLVVDDDGPGVATADRDRIFDRFIRLDEARGREGGGGLGLAIASEVARVHGGSVCCEEASLGGARFIVDLPIGTLGSRLPIMRSAA
ncbi:MAG: ATP-binding protein [Ilumatobacteraceae bacterium]